MDSWVELCRSNGVVKESRVGEGSAIAGTKQVMLRVLGLASRPDANTGSKGRNRSLRRKSSGPVQPENPFLRAPAAPATVAPDMEVSKPAGRLGPAIGRWGLRLFVWLIVVAGAWSVFVRPFIGGGSTSSAGGAGPAALVDQDAARAAATRFATDYLTWSPAATSERAAALAADTQSGADPAAVAFTGSTLMTALAAVPGHVQVYGPGSAVVTVDVRVSFAAARSKAVAASAAAQATALPTGTSSPGAPRLPGQPAVQAPTMPRGYQPKGVAWLRLAIPVVDQGGRLLVGAAGPVLLDDPVTTGQVGGDGTDGPQTDATQSWAGQFMQAYATSSTAYQAAPGVTLTGLGSTVRLSKIDSWGLSPPDDHGVRAGTVNVVWSLAGTDLAVPQRYSLAVTQDAGRWYVTSLGPAMAPSQ